MKKISSILVVCLVFAGCNANGLTPLDINYTVGSLEEYIAQVTTSTLTKNLSDFRMMELNTLNSKICNMYDYVITQGPTNIVYDKLINAVTNDFVEVSETDYSQIVKVIQEGKAIKLTPSGLFIPSIPELQEQAKAVQMPEVFAKSIIKELES